MLTKVLRTATLIMLVALTFVFGFSVGRGSGFETGSKWALMQAELAARQAGVFMPVYFDQNAFRVVIRQPDGVYRRAWHLADEYEAEQEVARTPKFARSLAPEKRPAETRF